MISTPSLKRKMKKIKPVQSRIYNTRGHAEAEAEPDSSPSEIAE